MINYLGAGGRLQNRVFRDPPGEILVLARWEFGDVFISIFDDFFGRSIVFLVDFDFPKKFFPKNFFNMGFSPKEKFPKEWKFPWGIFIPLGIFSFGENPILKNFLEKIFWKKKNLGLKTMLRPKKSSKTGFRTSMGSVWPPHFTLKSVF